MRLFLVAVLCLGAGAIDGRATAAFGPPGAGRQNAAPPAARDEPRATVLKAICASEFGQGDFARVEVFRNASGAVVVLALRPDITRFTHAPHTYFGPTGSSLLVVPERPVTPEQRKTDPVLRKQDDLLRGLVGGASASCSDHR
jgi:hypothetical protein